MAEPNDEKKLDDVIEPEGATQEPSYFRTWCEKRSTCRIVSALFTFLLPAADNALTGWKCGAGGESRRWPGKTAWRRGPGVAPATKGVIQAKSEGAGTSGIGGSGVHSGNERPRSGGR